MAYAVLGDEDKRAHYDRFGEVTADLPFGGGAGLDVQSATDFFDAIFGDLFGLGRKKSAGQDLRYTLELDFAEAALGCEQQHPLHPPGGLRPLQRHRRRGGAAGLSPCKRCGGQGFTKTKAGFFSTRRECLACGGAGEVPRVRCAGCQGTGLVERERDYVRAGAGGLGARAAPSGWRARARPGGAGARRGISTSPCACGRTSSSRRRQACWCASCRCRRPRRRWGRRWRCGCWTARSA